MIPWTHDLTEAAARAKQDDKLILLDFFNPT